MENKKYGYKIGEIVKSRIPLTDENGRTVPAGSQLRIVAIAPKIRIALRSKIANAPEIYDSRQYFANLVRGEQEKDYGARFRVNFVTFEKIKQIRKKI